VVLSIFALWEALSRTGAVNSYLLPSASDTLAMLGKLLQRASVRNDLIVTAGGADGIRPRGAHRSADRVPGRGKPLFCRGRKAAAVFRVQHPQIDLPANVHPGIRRRLCA